jgi:single-stranded DNA-binding protein
LSYATFCLEIKTAPIACTPNGVEVLEAETVTPQTDQPVNIISRVSTKAESMCRNFGQKKPGDLLIAGGELMLHESTKLPIFEIKTLCDGFKDQFLSEVVLVGRLSGTVNKSKSAKSARTGLAVNRWDYFQKKEITDWFNIRGFGYWADKFEKLEKGCLCEVHGLLTQSQGEKGAYLEIKVRSIKSLLKAKGQGGSPDPAAGTSAAGYGNEAFDGSDMPDFN